MLQSNFTTIHFGQTTADSVWIPDVTARGWIILTKDKNIRRSLGEREDVLLAGAKVFTLTSGSMNSAEMAQVFLDHLSSIEQTASTQGWPWSSSQKGNVPTHLPYSGENPLAILSLKGQNTFS